MNTQCEYEKKRNRKKLCARNFLRRVQLLSPYIPASTP